MKKNYLKYLLMVPVLAIVAGCTDPQTSSPTSTPTASESAQTSSAEEIPTVRVDKYQRLYLVNDEIVVEEVSQYSKALNQYSPAMNFSVEEIDMSTPGSKTVKVYVGSKYAEIQIEVYADGAAAAAANSIYDPATVDQYFKMSDYITDNNPKIDVYYEEVDGVKVFREYKGRTSKINGVNTQVETAIWTFDVPTGVTALPVTAMLDETRYTTPHYFDVVRDENGNVVRDENGQQILSDTEYLPCATYVKWRIEMILDSEGRIALLQRCMPDNAWTVGVGHVDTDKWFSHSIYEDNDDNPALIFGPDYLPETDYGRTRYEKVIPEGGVYAIMSTPEFVKNIWNKLVTEERQIDPENYSGDNEGSNDQKIFTQSNRGTELDSVRIKWDKENRRLRVYNDAKLTSVYAYYHSMVLRGEATEWDTFDADLETVIRTIVEENNPLIAQEPILATYYNGLGQRVIAEFGEKVEANLVIE